MLESKITGIKLIIDDVVSNLNGECVSVYFKFRYHSHAWCVNAGNVLPILLLKSFWFPNLG